MRSMQAWFASMDERDRHKAIVRLCKLARTLNLYKDSYGSNEEMQSTDSDNDDARSADSVDEVPVFSWNRGTIFDGPKKHIHTGKRHMKIKHLTNTNNHLHSLVTPTGDYKSCLSSMRGSNDTSFNRKRLKVCMFQYY